MNEEKAFLPHFIDEEIYVIDEVVSVEATPIKQESKAEFIEQEVKEEQSKSIAEEPKQAYETPSSSAKASESSQKVEEIVQPTVELTFYGQNAKGVLLLVDNISEEEKAFLEKVLGAVKLTMNDCALLPLSENNSTGHQKLIENFDCKTIINLGGQQLPFLQGISNYKINFVADKKALQTDDLTSIMTDVAKKKLLWENLKQLFP